MTIQVLTVLTPIFTIIISSIVTFMGIWVANKYQAPKLAADARRVAEDADELVFKRMEAYLATQERRLTAQATRIDTLETELADERSKRRELEQKLYEETGMRKRLEIELGNQQAQLRNLEEENTKLRQANEELARRIGTGNLR